MSGNIKTFRTFRLFYVFLVLFGLSLASHCVFAAFCGSVDEYTVSELLGDTKFSNGIQTWDGPYPMTETCQTNWISRVPTLKHPPENTPWRLVEVGEKMILCNQDTNPINGATITYTNPTDRSAPVDSKKIIDYKNALGVNLIFNSGEEWRSGCSLTENDELNGNAQPLYAANNGAWDWNHLLLAQRITDSSDANNQLMVNKYNKLLLDVSLKVSSSAKEASAYHVNGNCPEWTNHALFYVGVVLEDAVRPNDPSRRMFLIFPAWQTYDGTTYSVGGPWLGNDSANSKVYFTGMLKAGAKYEPLSIGNERTYSIDLQELAEEGVGAYNQKRSPTDPLWYTDDYYILEIYIGWEIWGGYDTNVIIRNPSLRAYTYTDHLCPQFHRYWSAEGSDHYYTTDYIPQGFTSYVYEGVAARIPTINMNNTAKLWRYYNPQYADHYYSTNLQPFGLNGSWVFERQAGSVFTSDPGAGYEKFEEWWCPNNTDHLYQLESGADPTWCYQKAPITQWLKDNTVTITSSTTSTTTSFTTSTTSTTTSSSSSTTSTSIQQCVMPGNNPPCGEVALSEVVSAINRWAADELDLGDVISLINSWADPSGHPPHYSTPLKFCIF